MNKVIAARENKAAAVKVNEDPVKNDEAKKGGEA